MRTHHMWPLGAWRLTWLLYWKAGAWRANKGSCPTTPRPRTVSSVPLSENMRQWRSRNCTAWDPRFSSRIQYRHCKDFTQNNKKKIQQIENSSSSSSKAQPSGKNGNLPHHTNSKFKHIVHFFNNVYWLMVKKLNYPINSWVLRFPTTHIEWYDSYSNTLCCFTMNVT